LFQQSFDFIESDDGVGNFGPWQGRLPQELRLHKIGTLELANQFLREHYVAEFNRITGQQSAL
jgi:hypothetical protein